MLSLVAESLRLLHHPHAFVAQAKPSVATTPPPKLSQIPTRKHETQDQRRPEFYTCGKTDSASKTVSSVDLMTLKTQVISK